MWFRDVSLAWLPTFPDILPRPATLTEQTRLAEVLIDGGEMAIPTNLDHLKPFDVPDDWRDTLKFLSVGELVGLMQAFTDPKDRLFRDAVLNELRQPRFGRPRP